MLGEQQGCGYSFQGQQGMNCLFDTNQRTVIYGWDGASFHALSATPRANLNPSPVQSPNYPKAVGQFLDNTIVYDGDSLYWAEGQAQQNTGWFGGWIVKMSKSGGIYTDILRLDQDSYPTGLAVIGDYVYAATSTSVATSGGGGGPFPVRGCRVVRVPKQGGKSQDIGKDPSRMCFRLGADATDAYLALWWGEGQDNTLNEGLGRVSNAGGAVQVLRTSDRDVLGLRSVVLSGSDVIGIATKNLLRVPKELFR